MKKNILPNILLLIFTIYFNAGAQTIVKQDIYGSNLYSVDGNAYFTRYDINTSTSSPWFSNGTDIGTYVLSTSIDGTTLFTKVGNNILFDGYNGFYRTTGTPQSVTLIKDAKGQAITPLTSYGQALLGDKIVFTSQAGNAIPAKVHCTDMSTNVTKLVDSFSTPWTSFANGYQTVNNKVVYLANTVGNAPQFNLYSFDGTTNTKLTIGSYSPYGNFAKACNMEINGSVYYAYDHDNPFEVRILKTNGTTCTDVVFLHGSAKGFTATSNAIYFQMFNASTGTELYKADLNFNNVTLVKDVNPGPASSYPQSFIVMNDIIYFLANHNAYGFELWKSDGKDAGTAIVKDIYPGPMSSYPNSPIKMFTMCDKLYLTANDSIHGCELWRTDGSEPGTLMVADIATGSSSSDISSIATSNGRLFFFATDSTQLHGNLYKLDECYVPAGITKTTILPSVIYPNPFSIKTTLKIDPQLTFSDAELQITDLYGRNIRTQTIYSNETIISKEGLSNGIYYYKVTKGTTTYASGKLVIE